MENEEKNSHENPVPEGDNAYCCSICGSTDVYELWWVGVNDKTDFDECSGELMCKACGNTIAEVITVAHYERSQNGQDENESN
jgi:hypothetical protein